jgi:hypothetical protein
MSMKSKHKVAILVAVVGALVAGATTIIQSYMEGYWAERARKDAKEIPENRDATKSWAFSSFTDGGLAADWISKNCDADPTQVYATLLGGDTFWVWCKPASTNSNTATFEYTSAKISPVAGPVPPPPFDRSRDIPISMGGKNYGYFLLFRRN